MGFIYFLQKFGYNTQHSYKIGMSSGDSSRITDPSEYRNAKIFSMRYVGDFNVQAENSIKQIFDMFFKKSKDIESIKPIDQRMVYGDEDYTIEDVDFPKALIEFNLIADKYQGLYIMKAMNNIERIIEDTVNKEVNKIDNKQNKINSNNSNSNSSNNSSNKQNKINSSNENNSNSSNSSNENSNSNENDDNNENSSNSNENDDNNENKDIKQVIDDTDINAIIPLLKPSQRITQMAKMDIEGKYGYILFNYKKQTWIGLGNKQNMKLNELTYYIINTNLKNMILEMYDYKTDLKTFDPFLINVKMIYKYMYRSNAIFEAIKY